MNPEFEDDIKELASICQKIVTKLENRAFLDEIVELTRIRHDLVSRLLEKKNLPFEIYEAVANELAKLRSAENEALEPYRREFAECQQTLINLNHAQEYLSNDP